jgi:hypothetical protein
MAETQDIAPASGSQGKTTKVAGKKRLAFFLVFAWRGSCDLCFLTGLPDVVGHEVAHLVEALRYKPEGRGFDWNFSLT